MKIYKISEHIKSYLPLIAMTLMRTIGTQQRKSVPTMKANRLAIVRSCSCWVDLSPILECEMVKNIEM